MFFFFNNIDNLDIDVKNISFFETFFFWCKLSRLVTKIILLNSKDIIRNITSNEKTSIGNDEIFWFFIHVVYKYITAGTTTKLTANK